MNRTTKVRWEDYCVYFEQKEFTAETAKTAAAIAIAQDEGQTDPPAIVQRVRELGDELCFTPDESQLPDMSMHFAD